MQTSTKNTANKEQIVIRTVYRDGVEITIIERKQEPTRYNGMDV